jgi:NAD(P)-dependent dehydrogenase (short-subunit alcohol dehydrogenase family)
MRPALGDLASLLSLVGKRALITGAGAGIGRAIALRFAQAGAALHLVDIDAEAVGQTLEGLGASAGRSEVHVLDVAKRSERDALWDALGDRVPDILVNNAAIYPFRDFLDVDEALYDRVLAVNLDAVYWLCQEMIRRRLRSGGVIINLASIEAVLPFKDDLAHYSISKAGVIALTRALAKEHAKHGFRVNALIPGGINTPGTRRAAMGVLKFKLGLIRTGIEFKRRLPIGRVGEPDEVARMALVLASDLASYVHGAAIPVDGGFLSA